MTQPVDPQRVEEETSQQNFVDGALAANALRESQAGAALGKGLADIHKAQSTAQGTPQQAGFVAEVHHEATFNTNAARKGAGVRAERPQGNGSADLKLKATSTRVTRTDGKIRIEKTETVVREVQVKNCKTPARTTKAISDKKYDGMQKVVPEDQVASVKRLADKRGPDGLGERNYADTSQNASATVEHGGVRSKGLTYDEAQSRDLSRKLVVGEMGSAAAAGAKSAAVVGGAFSAATNIKAAWDGDKSVLEATGDFARDTAVAAAAGAGSAVLTNAVSTVAARAGMQVLSKSGAPGALVSVGLEVGKDFYALSQGTMTGREVAARSVEHATGAAAAWGGASAGAALGTMIFPGVGTVIGGFLGGMAATFGARKGIDAIKSL